MNTIDCLKCKHPGACCKAFDLSGTEDLIDAWIKDDIPEMLRILKDDLHLPFLPLEKITDLSDPPDRWVFYCPKLGTDGLCTIYESRPETCRCFKPGSDPICVYFEPVNDLDRARVKKHANLLARLESKA